MLLVYYIELTQPSTIVELKLQFKIRECQNEIIHYKVFHYSEVLLMYIFQVGIIF